MHELVLSDGMRKGLARLTFQRAQGQGRVLPRLIVSVRVEALGDDRWILIPRLDAQLTFASEVIAIGTLIGGLPVSSRSGSYRDMTLEFPVSQGLLRYANDHLAGHKLDLIVELRGMYHSLALDAGNSLPSFPSEGWETHWVEFGSSELRFQVARSDWFSEVVQPIGTDEIIFTEMRLPKSEGNSDLHKALANIVSAERAHFQGDDPATFLHCRGAIDALPGAKKDIFGFVHDAQKRERLDALAKELGALLHSGRHVATEGSERGGFPIDHRDAGFVLSLTKLLVAYVSQLTAK